MNCSRACWRYIFGGIVVVALGLTGLASVQFRLQLSELEREGSSLKRSASQLVGQHDAHLTALSAIAVASAGQRPDLFLEVSGAVSRFYPRIENVYLIPLDRPQDVIGSAPLSREDAVAIRKAVDRSTGTHVLLANSTDTTHYFLIKHSDAARYALTLDINVQRLITSDRPFWSRDNVQLGLYLPDGVPLVGYHDLVAPQFSQALTSVSQPLRIEAAMRLGPSELLPIWQALGTTILLLLVYVSILIGLRQRSRLKQAERKAELARVEAKLSHAMRINSMGEMASGIAHELTQPLTAILAKLQASQRLLKQGESERLTPVLQDAVEQSRRGAAILERLRNWSRPQRGPLEAIDLRNAVQNVIALLLSGTKSRLVAIRYDAPASDIRVVADQVEMEQVLHNLVRNALEAVSSTADARIDIRLARTAEEAILEISDNGPGVDAAVLPRLFVPFTTTRDRGTGLGLALSQRLIERAGGELTHSPSPSGATFRVRLPLVNYAKEETP